MLIFLAAMAALLSPGERLAMPMPAGFITAHQQTAGVGSIEERIATGETVEQWTRMITLITLFSEIAIEEYAPGFEAQIRQGCPGATAAPRIAASMGAHPAIDGRLDCPRNPATGLPETFLYRVVNDGTQLHMIQVAFRRVPSAADIAWAQERIDSAVLCSPPSARLACAPVRPGG